LSWADWHLNYQIDEERKQVRVFYDEDGSGMVGVLDISDYAGLPIEEVCVAPDSVGFDLDSEAFEGEENIALDLCVGVKLAGYEDVFINGLSPIVIQVLLNEDEDGGFRFGQPKVDERYQIHNLRQERKLEEIRSGEREDALAEPFDNLEGHNDVRITFVNPCPDYERISDQYGERIHPVTREKRMHNGVDMAAPLGADVLAAADGTVYRTGYDLTNGNYVVLWHGLSGQMTYYTGCQDILVSEGDRVSARDKIATVGQTGRSTGPHLHFAVSYEGEWQEPVWGGTK
ncbi:MAG: M23 family metallopeptidase, partial [Lachnospiraceae bacterium]|nr:M23 family metallopeptidase [Lachnospiraceae bacterium]